MKTFLRIAFAQLFVCLTISAFAQTPQEQWSTPGSYNWVCPVGVTSITLYLWSAGGSGGWQYSGAGGNLVHSTAIPVTPGHTYQVFVGVPAVTTDSANYSNTGFRFSDDSTMVAVYGPYFHAEGTPTPAPAWPLNGTSPYVYSQHIGGAGQQQVLGCCIFLPAGGGGAASDCADGLAANSGSGIGGQSPHCDGYLWGGDGGNQGYAGNAPGGGGGGTNFNYNDPPIKGGPGLVMMYYTCIASAGVIGNAHTVTYPPEFKPDKITSIINPTLPVGATIAWQQSTDNINFVTAKNNTNTSNYRFDLDSIQIPTYYRRGSNGCVNGFGNWTDTVQIKVMTSTNGRNGKVTGYVQTRNGTAIANRTVYVQSLTPLKGRSVGFLDSAYTDFQGKFSVDSIFYGDKNNGDSATVRFKVYADTSNGHSYDPGYALINLSALNGNNVYDLSSKPFRDTALYALTGQVYQVCAGCLDANGHSATITAPLDSVNVYGTGQHHSLSQNEKDSSKTGYRNPPGAYGNYGLVFQYTDNYTITPKFNNHKFKPSDSLVVLNGNVKNVNFEDTTTHVISGFFGAGCNDIIGNAVLEFSDSLPRGIDGKVRLSAFKKQVTTKSNGKFSIRLPARAYKVKIISVTVNDPFDGSTNQTTIKSFFKALPVANLYRDITNADTVLNLIYNRPPNIAVLGLNADSSRVQSCAAFKNYDFWPQSIRRPITFKVYQGPVSRGCLLDTGRVYVTTDISNTLGNYQFDTVTLAGGIGVDSIMAAQPNTVINPGTGTYSKKFSATYTDIINRTVSTDNANPALPLVVVTGAAVDPNATNFVTVSPQIPFVVLHDPPGNKSLSSWTQSVTTEQAISFKAEQQNTEGGFINVKVGLSEILGMFVEIPIDIWVKIDQSFSTTNTTSNTTESIITNTTEQTIETADDPPSTGVGADVVYGAALNINYKQGVEIDWDSSTCAIVGPRIIMVTDIKNDTTSFIYTIGHITDELIPTLRQAANSQTNADSAAYFENQIHVWEQLVENNAENIKNAPVIKNISFSNGTSNTYTNTLENSTTNTYDFNLEIDKDLAISAGFEIAGIGLDGGYNVGFKMSTGGSVTNSSKSSTTTSYLLKDDNGPGPHFSGDYFSVNIKKDPVYGTPMFETVAGGSMCPYVPGTIPLDYPVLTSNVQTLTEVKKDTANFTLYLNNLSLDATTNGARPYILFLNAASNPSGATVLIGGTSDPNGVNYVVPNNGGVQTVTVSVIRNTASNVYSYDNLEFIASDNCYESPVAEKFFNAPHQFSSIKLSADFASPVSGVTMVTPVNNWVANQLYHDTIPVTFNGYDTSKLASIAFQYNIPATSSWVTVYNYAKNKLGKTSTTYKWKISKLADGPYNLRLQVKDKNNNIVYSPVAAGLIDRTAPALFGIPKPSDGIYRTGTQITYRYNENINTSIVRNSMANMRDMTSNTAIPVQLSAFINRIIILPSNDISSLAGHLLRLIVDSVADVYGNIRSAKDTSYFNVAAKIFSTGADALNIGISKTSIYEDATKGSMDIKFTRNAAVTGPTVIYYAIAGNAVFNKDYKVVYNNGQTTATGINGSEGTIILPKDSSVVTMYIKPLNDSVSLLDKKLIITLSDGGGYGIGSNYTVTGTILNHNIAAPVITANKPTTLCAGDSVTLSTATTINGKPVTLLWSTGAKTSSITVKTSGSYTVKATDNKGFIGYSAPTIVTFTCGNPAGLTATVLSKTSAVLNWSAANCAVKYAVQYRQVGKPNWTTDTIVGLSDTLKNLKANTSYQWQVASICQYPIIIISGYTAGANFTTPVSLTEIAVTITDDYKVATAGDGFSATVYPNPALSTATLNVKGTKGPYTVMVTNLQGVVLWKAENVTDSNVKLPLANFAAGIYMVTVKDQLHTGTLKLMKQ